MPKDCLTVCAAYWPEIIMKLHVLFIEVAVPSKQSEMSFIWVLPLSTNLQFDFATIPTGWYFGTVPTGWYFGTVPTGWYFGTVPTGWYFGTIPTGWYFGTVPTGWYFLFFILLYKSVNRARAPELLEVPAPLVNKGNNKITELRTILQRESQNS